MKNWDRSEQVGWGQLEGVIRGQKGTEEGAWCTQGRGPGEEANKVYSAAKGKCLLWAGPVLGSRDGAGGQTDNTYCHHIKVMDLLS